MKQATEGMKRFAESAKRHGELIETRHYRRAAELSPVKTKEENERALKTLKRRAAAKKVEHVTHRVYTWKDIARTLLCATVGYVIIWVWYLALGS